MSTCDSRISTHIATACTATTMGTDIATPLRARISPMDLRMRMKRRVSSMAKTLMCTAAIWSILWFQAGAGFAQETTVPTSNVAPPLRIGSGDLIEVSVYDNPDLSGRFRGDGKGGKSRSPPWFVGG